MGLASYGEKNSAEYAKLKSLIKLMPDGGYKIDMQYFAYHYSRKNGVSQKFLDEFGPANLTGDQWTERELNIAAAAQHVVEDVILHLVKRLKQITNAKNLCMAGGVALNSVANGVIAKTGLFENIFIQPAAGDSGTSLGAALLIDVGILKNPRRYIQKDAFLGPSYNFKDYEAAFERHRLPFKAVERCDLYRDVAKRIYDGNIIGWFQGRMEFGPRALGNRSFLATPLRKNMKDILNARVKFRESFRPFAAIVIEEDAGLYFDCAAPNPYMLFVYEVKKEYRDLLPAITHVDNTVRIQTVNKEESPELYSLLLAFKELTGYGVLINTSFNIRGEPIVCSPDDAVNSFLHADIDALVMGDYISEKSVING
ncbi:MAG: hypothetical protein HY226_00685 [Candidatus Vogelbacteria bacterium]|nr:hypothetical protein [Candidatus Vogelbacteria bacterium]